MPKPTKLSPSSRVLGSPCFPLEFEFFLYQMILCVHICERLSCHLTRYLYIPRRYVVCVEVYQLKTITQFVTFVTRSLRE